MNTSRKEERQDHSAGRPAVAYFRHDTLGLVMEKNGQVCIYAPKKGLFQPAASAYITEDASALNFESAKQLWENYNRHYARLREADAPAPQPLQPSTETPRASPRLQEQEPSRGSASPYEPGNSRISSAARAGIMGTRSGR